MHVFMALPPCAADALTNAARVSVFAIPPRPRSSGPDKFCGCLFLRSPPPAQFPPLWEQRPESITRGFLFSGSPPSETKARNNTNACCCFRGPLPLRSNGPDNVRLCVHAAAARTPIRTLPIETVTRNKVQCFRVTCSHSLFCMNSMAWVLSCFLLSIVLQSLAPTKPRRNTW